MKKKMGDFGKDFSLSLLSGGDAEDFEIWNLIKAAFSNSKASDRKKAIDQYLSQIAGYSDLRLELALARINSMRDALSGEEWLLSERLVSDLLQEMSRRDEEEMKQLKSELRKAKLENKSNDPQVAEVIDLLSRKLKDK